MEFLNYFGRKKNFFQNKKTSYIHPEKKIVSFKKKSFYIFTVKKKVYFLLLLLKIKKNTNPIPSQLTKDSENVIIHHFVKPH